MSTASAPKLDDLKLAKEEALKLLRPNGNILGVGIGKKQKDGKATDEDCIRVYVIEKIPHERLTPKSLVPEEFIDARSDVIGVERFGRAGQAPAPSQDDTPHPGSAIRVRTSAPNVNAGAIGTLGVVATDGPKQYILSCNHVLSRNGRVPKNASIVSAELVGDEKDIADPTGFFVPLDSYGPNSVDCALALLPKPVSEAFPDGFQLSSGSPTEPKVDMKVVKFGAATNTTKGTIVDINLDLYVDYSFGTFLFENQILIECQDGSGDFAAEGDSGAIVIDETTKQAVAMIFASSGRFAVACPLDDVLKQLAGKAKVEKLELVIAAQRKGN